MAARHCAPNGTESVPLHATQTTHPTNLKIVLITADCISRLQVSRLQNNFNAEFSPAFLNVDVCRAAPGTNRAEALASRRLTCGTWKPTLRHGQLASTCREAVQKRLPLAHSPPLGQAPLFTHSAAAGTFQRAFARRAWRTRARLPRLWPRAPAPPCVHARRAPPPAASRRDSRRRQP